MFQEFFIFLSEQISKSEHPSQWCDEFEKMLHLTFSDSINIILIYTYIIKGPFSKAVDLSLAVNKLM